MCARCRKVRHHDPEDLLDAVCTSTFDLLFFIELRDF